MSRSVKKGPFCEESLMNRIIAMNEKGEKKPVKTWSRASVIFPEFVGHTIANPANSFFFSLQKPLDESESGE